MSDHVLFGLIRQHECLSINAALRNVDTEGLEVLLLAEVWVGSLPDVVVPLFSQWAGFQAQELHLHTTLSVIPALFLVMIYEKVMLGFGRVDQ